MQLDLCEIKARIPAKGRRAADTATGRSPTGRPGPAPPVGHPGCGAGRGGGDLFKPRARRRRGQSGCQGWPCAAGPLRSAPAGMADLLTSGQPPDEQDFIQAYEEVREKYKGTEPLAPVPLSERASPSRLASLTAGRVPSCCPDRCPNRVQSVAASFTSLVRPL